jgi:HlyD family secretion protein
MAVDRTKRRVNANLAQAEADFKAKNALLQEEKSELEEIESEVAKARIVAPIDGMVLYASSVADDWDDDQVQIEVGALIDEQDEIIYLPTTAAYTVDVKILEVNLRKISVGQRARILVDAMPGKAFSGQVTRIAPLPDSSSRFLNPNLKLYNTKVSIENTDPALRNGMSCRVEIEVEQYPDVVHVPVQCVTRVSGQPTVHVITDGHVTPQPVDIGLDNGRFVHVRGGLQGGETVLLTPPLSTSELERERQEEAEAQEARQRADGPGPQRREGEQRREPDRRRESDQGGQGKQSESDRPGEPRQRDSDRQPQRPRDGSSPAPDRGQGRDST